MQAMTCRVCGANLHADDVNTEMGIAKCRYCDAVFAFGAAVGGGRSAEASSVAVDRQRAEVERPSGFTIEEDAYRFRIVRRWRSWAVIPLLIFAVLWNGFVAVWYGIGIGMLLQGDRMAIVMMLFGLIHLAVGLGLIYGVVTMLVNSTTVDVNDRELTIGHGPIWFPGNKTLPSLDIKQLYCKQKVSHSKNGTSIRYALHAVMNTGEDEKLLTGLNQQNHAIYVEQQVERVLGIKDEAVAGESV